MGAWINDPVANSPIPWTILLSFFLADFSLYKEAVICSMSPVPGEWEWTEFLGLFSEGVSGLLMPGCGFPLQLLWSPVVWKAERRFVGLRQLWWLYVFIFKTCPVCFILRGYWIWRTTQNEINWPADLKDLSPGASLPSLLQYYVQFPSIVAATKNIALLRPNSSNTMSGVKWSQQAYSPDF